MTPPTPDFWDFITDAFKLMRHRDDIRRAVGEAVDAADIAAKSIATATRHAAVAAADVELMTAKLRVAKDLILNATD